MTQRKPSGMPFETFIERQIREARERGEFDDLPGAGKPIPDLEKPHDELWWVRGLMKREGLSYVPPSMEMRLEVERLLEGLAAVPTERALRRRVAELNVRIAKANATTTSGPATNLGMLDADRVLALWRSSRS